MFISSFFLHGGDFILHLDANLLVVVKIFILLSDGAFLNFAEGGQLIDPLSQHLVLNSQVVGHLSFVVQGDAGSLEALKFNGEILVFYIFSDELRYNVHV